jgi:hypothetical protein
MNMMFSETDHMLAASIALYMDPVIKMRVTETQSRLDGHAVQSLRKPCLARSPLI